MSAPAPKSIRLHNVQQNNLKGFDLDIPIGQLTVVTGLSGSGKSSLVFETLHAEGQRRYVETFSPYTRQFLDLLDRPKVDRVDNIRPSIAVEQTNSVKTSRSTVGTITELCDYFKVWFCQNATLYDPASGAPIRDDNPQSCWQHCLERHRGRTLLITFPIARPKGLSWEEIAQSLSGQGYTRCLIDDAVRRIDDAPPKLLKKTRISVVQDRIKMVDASRARFVESAQSAFRFGNGSLILTDDKGAPLEQFREGLRSPVDDRRFRAPVPALFSFNSPIGACPTCRGFGRVIEIDDQLIIPDGRLSVDDGAIRAFHGDVYSESLRDLQRAARRHHIPTNIPWNEMDPEDQAFVMDGEPDYDELSGGWYGVRGFFSWLEKKAYRMHVRVFLSKFRSYKECPDCKGARLQPESLLWKWQGFTLPDLYRMPVSDLAERIQAFATNQGAKHKDPALEGILTRLSYIEQVGLGYLSLDRSSRSLSGGEMMRVSLTSCLGASLVDTLFVLDEPSVGLHARDLDRLIGILRRLADSGNTVVVVEHDEAVMRAADHLVEIGPEPGKAGGQLIFSGPPETIHHADTPTMRYLTGRDTIPVPKRRSYHPKPSKGDKHNHPTLSLYGVRKHNLAGIDFHLPLKRLLCLSGVSGSGKSTLLNNALYQNLLIHKGQPSNEPAAIDDLVCDLPIGEVVFVDQSPVSKTPRSNAAVFTKAWDEIRKLFAATEAAKSAGLTPSHFSFNSGDGRCDTCSGLGYERIEMQFISDVFVPCPSCGGKRFKPEILNIQWEGHAISDVLEMDIRQALEVFQKQKKIIRCLKPLIDVGLGYLTLGQPLNTLSGGEAQRLKLVRYLGQVKDQSAHALILIDEPTTGLHRADVKRLISVLQTLVDGGHSVIVIEHNLDVLKSADWIVELGPEAGINGGDLVAAGPPETVAESGSLTGHYLALELGATPENTQALAAEGAAPFRAARPDALEIIGAREHNLRNLSVRIPHNTINVVTGVSGSGKTSLAFDIIFAEGQRRFMDSMSAYARQFVEQLPRPKVDAVNGIAPTVSIEQRVTRGTRKSTVATITEVAQYLRLLYARIGIQHSPTSGEAVITQDAEALFKRLKTLIKKQSAKHYYLCAELVRGRKGHHQPIADWARDHGYRLLRIDGQLIPIELFKKLDRYREHDIAVVIADLGTESEDRPKASQLRTFLKTALKLGKGTAFLLHPGGKIDGWLSTQRTDPSTGEAFPALDPKHFSWNSSKGWCPTCRGHGRIYDWMYEREDWEPLDEDYVDGALCPDCHGSRLNPVSAAVRLPLKGKAAPISLPELLELRPQEALTRLAKLDTDQRSRAVLDELLPEIEERLRFMEKVGLGYLSLDRATATLSGGEAQRIRLAAQLGSNLSGVLYVLDEPSIGLHARDNAKLIESLQHLRDRGNTLVIVEHDETTMAAADRIFDLGPKAGVHGGELMAQGTFKQIKRNKASLTGQYLRQGIAHPLRGSYRPLPAAWNPRKRSGPVHWLALEGASLRNLKGFDLTIPLQRLTVVCGVSGAGKSTLTRDLLLPLVKATQSHDSAKLQPRDLLNAEDNPLPFSTLKSAPFRSLHGGNALRKVIEVDQAPIGKTLRSTPATYIGAFDTIRELFANLPESRARGYTSSTFSFNTKGGRCESCKGAGRIKLEMNFMPDTFVTCEDCGGSRYSSELLDLRWNGRNIADVLDMTFEEAAEFFSFHSGLSGLLKLMVETGLGYIKLGQSSPSLSGGEAQRLKLVSELAKGLPTFTDRKFGTSANNLYILEEPTIGLHLSDCERLIELLHRLVDQGHTVVVIEHHLDVIADADYVVEIGPDGGDAGGQLVFSGTVADLAKAKHSVTAPFLQSHLK